MGILFKKEPCPICGGKIAWLLPKKIEDEYVCSNCYNKIDMETDKATNLTMKGFREYLAFYDQNQLLKDQFMISERIYFGLRDIKIIFDYQNKLFCMSKNPDKTIFEGKDLKSFTVKEDNASLFEGLAEGILRYASTVPERVMAMGPQISQFVMNKQMSRALDKLDDGKQNNSAPVQYFDVPEPFHSFNVELHFDHPYWTVIQCEIEGPRFDNDRPNVSDYLRSYRQNIEEIEKLITAFKTVAFPNAPEAQIVHIASVTPADAIEEIKKYKVLIEEGIISGQEFEAKKKQLLGI